MTSHEIHLQLGETFGRYRDFAELAESGGDTVHDASLTHDAIDVIVRAQHAGADVVGERYATIAACNGLHVGDRERIPVENDSVTHWWNVGTPRRVGKPLQELSAISYQLSAISHQLDHSGHFVRYVESGLS